MLSISQSIFYGKLEKERIDKKIYYYFAQAAFVFDRENKE